LKEYASILEELDIDPHDNNGSLPLEVRRETVNRGVNGCGFIIGAGVTGLTTAWQLASAGLDVQVLEASSHVGGMATTFRHENLLLDQGPHKFFSVMEDRMQMAEEIIGSENFLVVPKRSRIRLAGRFVNYPLGFIDILKNLNPTVAITGGLSYLFQLVRNLFDRSPMVSYEDYLVRRFGRRLYELVFADYARKIWGDPKRLARELAETRVAIPGLASLIWKMLITRGQGPVIHAETFRYPKMGTGEFSRRLAELVLEHGGSIRFGSAVVGLGLKDNLITSIRLGSGEQIAVSPTDVVVTTIPVGYLVKLLKPTPPEDIFRAASGLKTRNLILLYVIIDRPSVSSDSWLFFPEAKYVFTRVFEQKNFSQHMIPKDKTCLCLEIVAPDEKVWYAPDADLYERAISGLEDVGLVRRSEVAEYFTRRLKWVYPVYDLDYKKNARVVLDYLDTISNLYSVGRQGGFNYVGQIDCLDIGVVTAEHILQGDRKARWAEARQRFADYIVLD
jgi:protoporphyrinogen oxidase